MEFLVTTKKDRIPTGRQIIMVDGTVPGWTPKDGDLHFDHHRPEGTDTQIQEINGVYEIKSDALFVTTQVDADACVAAAYLMLGGANTDVEDAEDVYNFYQAIAYDCDHLGVPPAMEEGLAQFARNAVAALKQHNNVVAKELQLPQDRKTWNEQQKEQYASECFKQGAEWLVESAKGKRDWPGENGEADAYWENVERIRPYVELCSYMYKGVAILDQRSLRHYCDPRLLVEWARQQKGHSNITLTVRSRELVTEDFKLPGWSYTLGSVPLHQDGSPKFSDNGVWEHLAFEEQQLRSYYKLPHPSSDWGGRNEVGGSSWNDAVVMTPEQVIDCVLEVLNND